MVGDAGDVLGIMIRGRPVLSTEKTDVMRDAITRAPHRHIPVGHPQYPPLMPAQVQPDAFCEKGGIGARC
jgi:hypothetical protein